MSERCVVDAITSSYSPLKNRKNRAAILQGSDIVETLKPPKYPPIVGRPGRTSHDGFRLDVEWEHRGVYEEVFGCEQTRPGRFPPFQLDPALTPSPVV